jgi:hypothetical protein
MAKMFSPEFRAQRLKNRFPGLWIDFDVVRIPLIEDLEVFTEYDAPRVQVPSFAIVERRL